MVSQALRSSSFFPPVWGGGDTDSSGVSLLVSLEFLSLPLSLLTPTSDVYPWVCVWSFCAFYVVSRRKERTEIHAKVCGTVAGSLSPTLGPGRAVPLLALSFSFCASVRFCSFLSFLVSLCGLCLFFSQAPRQVHFEALGLDRRRKPAHGEPAVPQAPDESVDDAEADGDSLPREASLKGRKREERGEDCAQIARRKRMKGRKEKGRRLSRCFLPALVVWLSFAVCTDTGYACCGEAKHLPPIREAGQISSFECMYTSETFLERRSSSFSSRNFFPRRGVSSLESSRRCGSPLKKARGI